MIGVHAFWSKPVVTGTFGHHTEDEKSKFSMFPFELIHFICSALNYKQLNGPIHLYTDETFYNYLTERGYDVFWDKIDIDKAKEFELLRVDSRHSWTSFKTWLVGQLDTPFLVLDHDNMIYTKIPEILFDADLRFAHWETLDDSVYVSKEQLEINDFDFDTNWNWDLNVANTSIMYFNNKTLSSEYSYRALDFLSKHKPTTTKAQRTQYLFADQRLLSMIAEAGDYNFGTFSNSIFDVRKSQNIRITDFEDLDQVGFDHTWFFKHKLKDDYENNIEGEVKPYIDRHEQIIKDSFPQYYDLLKPLYYASK
jgi:hypothetical protein